MNEFLVIFGYHNDPRMRVKVFVYFEKRDLIISKMNLANENSKGNLFLKLKYF